MKYIPETHSLKYNYSNLYGFRDTSYFGDLFNVSYADEFFLFFNIMLVKRSDFGFPF